MSRKQTVTEELDATERRLSNLKAELDGLAAEAKKLEHNISDASDGARFRQLRATMRLQQQEIADLEPLRGAYRKRLDEFQANEPEAAKIRERAVKDVYAQGIDAYAVIQGGLTKLSKDYAKMQQANQTLRALAEEHEKLVGESFGYPELWLPMDVRRVVGIRLDASPKWEMKLPSEMIREFRGREQQSIRVALERQQKTLRPYFDTAKQAWPRCPQCNAELLNISNYPSAKADPETMALVVQLSCPEGHEVERHRRFKEIQLGPTTGARTELKQVSLRGD